MVIKPHPRTITAHEAQMMPRYFPEWVTEKPAMTDIPAEPAENGIILKGVLGGSGEHTPLPGLT